MLEVQELTLACGTVAIREATPEDAQSFIDHRSLTCVETEYLAYDADEVPRDVAAQEKKFEEMAGDRKRCVLLATLDGEVVGFVGIAPTFGSRKFSHRAGLAVSVEQRLWGQGIGRALLTSVIEVAREGGYTQLELGVIADNTRARGLYERLGFRVWGVHPRSVRLSDGRYHDEVEMWLPLDEE